MKAYRLPNGSTTSSANLYASVWNTLGHAREGIVIRTVEPVNGNLISGKVIDPDYLLKIKE